MRGNWTNHPPGGLSRSMSDLPSTIVFSLTYVIWIFLWRRSTGYKISDFVSLEMFLLSSRIFECILMGIFECILIQFWVDSFILPELKMVSVDTEEMSPAIITITPLKIISLLLLLRSLFCHFFVGFTRICFSMGFFMFVLLEFMVECLKLSSINLIGYCFCLIFCYFSFWDST